MRPYLHFRLALEMLVCFLAFAQTAKAGTAAAATLSTGVLSPNRDTVFGVYDTFKIEVSAVWQPKETLVVRNNSGKEVVLDSFSLRPDSSWSGRLCFAFTLQSSRGTYLGEYQYRSWDFNDGKTNALRSVIRLPAHDSILLGQFGILLNYAIQKVTASSNQYKAGDSIATPLAFFSGKDSVKFQLRAKVMPGVFYHPVTIKRGETNIKRISISNGFLANGRIQKGSHVWLNAPTVY